MRKYRHLVGKNVGQVGFSAVFRSVDAKREKRPLRPPVDGGKGFGVAGRNDKVFPAHVRAVGKFQRQLIFAGHGFLFLVQHVKYLFGQVAEAERFGHEFDPVGGGKFVSGNFFRITGSKNNLNPGDQFLYPVSQFNAI